MAAPRILLFADCGPTVGGGHVMRCLTLARALAERGAACAFVAPPMVRGLIETFGPGAIETLDTPDATVEQVRALANAYRPDWLVIDHYRLTLADERALRAPGRRLMVMDDLADRPRDCDLLLDPGYGRVAEDYRGLVPEGAQVLAGPSYALVRPEFAAARPQALAARQGSVRRVLLSLGLTDVGGITCRVVQALLPTLGDVQLDIALGSAAPSLEALAAMTDPHLTLHVDAPDMARLMCEADIAIGAGGSSTWERACLGLPAVTVILAENQRDLALRMQADGLTVAVEAEDSLEAALIQAFARLEGNDALRAAMSARLGVLCDGLGAQRTAGSMIELR
ncbi:MAG TPA: UDP-2,4-diacetamido-2,4,6-trideoxy-beta-L-altropyranose hydrolase [Caulobacteraceae bacterium]|nr:UDP-2,4-diacetamido-2,4,6-trideoxy-beta-L-altropyranose hydrolase [Caulobacteraceae bacterium]